MAELGKVLASLRLIAETKGGPGRRLADVVTDLVETIGKRVNQAVDDLAAARAELETVKAERDALSFEGADWFYRTMDPDDCGDSPEEAINRGMVGRFCVCEIASSYAGPTRYGFIAPVLDPESDGEEFIHFATQQEAIDAAKARAALQSTPAQKEQSDE